MSPTTRSLALLRGDGYIAEVVEQNVPHARTKRDLFGFIDIVAIRGTQTLAVQTTSASNVNARLNKIAASPHLPAIEAAGWRLVCHGWRDDGRLREVVVLKGAAPMKHLHTPEAHARSKAKRAANIAATRPTTRPGSESTDLKVGDAVFVYIPDARTAVSRAYHGRKGFVASINAQTFDSGTTYVEVGVSWFLATDVDKMSVDTWFRADEVRGV